MLKLGVIDVLNVLPVYDGILRGLISVEAELIKGKVTELNQKLNQGELDLSVISSFEYARNPEKYLILPGLSVSAKGPVRSIYLFSKVPLEELTDCVIRLTEFSLTSVHLVQYLLQGRGVTFEQREGLEAPAEILIADEAIRHYYQGAAPYVYDLSQLWLERTGLPFVFALWVVRGEVAEREPHQVRAVYQALLASKALSEENYPLMAKDHFRGIFPDAQGCEDYLRNLHYEFGEDYQEGFRLFQQKMVEIGKLRALAPLRFFC